MDTNRKKVVVIALIVLTLVLGGLAVGISYYIQQNQAPDDSSADVTCASRGGACGLNIATCAAEGGTNIGTLNCGSSICCVVPTPTTLPSCSGTYSGGACRTACASSETAHSGTDCESGGASLLCCAPSRTQLNDCTTMCTNTAGCICPTNPVCALGSGVNIVYQARCGVVSVTQDSLNSCTATCTDGDGCTCPSGCQNSTVGNGASCGVVSTGGGGNTNTGGGTTTTKSQCGGSCTTNADCAASPSGASVVCRNGVCENAACAAGKTVPGANCECSALNACGQPCSASLGLCQAGSQCGFIGSATACTSAAQSYCLPTSPYRSYTLATCSGIAAYNLRSPLGTDVTTQAQILEACTQPTTTATAVCGDGVCSASESSFTCPNDCTLPNTSVFSDRIDRIILGIVVIVLGISLAGGFDKFRKMGK